MGKVLVFTVIEKLEYTYDGIVDGKLADWLEAEIKKEYRFEGTLHHESIMGSEAMNGDILYVEVVSDNKEAMDKVVQSLSEANIRYREDLDKWVEKDQFTFLENDDSISEWDEYLIQI